MPGKKRGRSVKVMQYANNGLNAGVATGDFKKTRTKIRSRSAPS